VSEREQRLVGLSRFELLTPRLSSVCSNQLSYRPVFAGGHFLANRTNPAYQPPTRLSPRTNFSKNSGCPGSFKTRQSAHFQPVSYQIDLDWLSADGFRLTGNNPVSREPTAVGFSRKEVIQPQVLLQLPCYDFTPITDHTLGTCLPCGLAGLLLVQPAFVM